MKSVCGGGDVSVDRAQQGTACGYLRSSEAEKAARACVPTQPTNLEVGEYRHLACMWQFVARYDWTFRF